MAFDVSRRTFNRILLNFLWAYGYNVVSGLSSRLCNAGGRRGGGCSSTDRVRGQSMGMGAKARW